MAKMVNFGLAYGMSDFGLSTPGGHPAARRPRSSSPRYFADLLRDQLLHAPHPGDGPAAGLRLDAARAAAGRSPSSMRRNPAPARRRRADGDQHADPGHGRGHRQDRDDPARRPRAARGRLPGPAAASRSTTSSCSRCRATRSTGSSRSCADDGDGPALSTSRSRSTSRSATTGTMRHDPRCNRREARPRCRPPMPELPEVETVVRDLRPRSAGPRSAAPACVVGADPADPSGRGLRARRSRGRRIEAVGRRGKLLVLEPGRRRRPDDPPQDDRPAVRRPGRDCRGSLRAARSWRFDDGRELRFRDIRKFGRVGLYDATGQRPAGHRGRRGGVFDGFGPEPLDPSFTLREFRRRLRARRAGSSRSSSTRRSSPAIGNIYADEALWRPASTRSARPRRCARPTSGALYRRSARDPGRGRRAARQLDRRLHGARRRRRDAGAPRRLPAHRPAVPALRPADPADRDRDPGDPLLLVVPAPAGASIGRAPRTLLAAMTPRPGAAATGRRAALGGARRRGRAGPDRRRSRRPPRAHPADGGAAAAAAAPARRPRCRSTAAG